MIRVCIVDDEALAAERLERLCAAMQDVQVVGVADSAREALAVVRDAQPDVLLLDIAMPETDGLTFARALSSSEPTPAIVFVTAHDGYAVAAFELDVLDYLLKPVTAERLQQALKRVEVRRSGRSASQIPVNPPGHVEWWASRGSRLIRLTADEVDVVEAERDYARLHIGARSFLVRETMTSLEQRLDPATFVRVHRSFIVRRALVRSVERDHGQWTLTLSNGRTAPVGRTYAPRLREIVRASRTGRK